MRVLTRLQAIAEVPSRAPVVRALWGLAEDLALHSSVPEKLTQAILDLGATVCTIASPKCAACPVRQHCRAVREDGGPQRYPASKPAPLRTVMASLVLVVCFEDDRVALVRRKDEGLLAGLLNFPTFDWRERDAVPHAQGSECEAARAALLAEVFEDGECRAPDPPVRVAALKHRFTHIDQCIAVECVRVVWAAQLRDGVRVVTGVELEKSGVCRSTQAVYEVARAHIEATGQRA